MPDHLHDVIIIGGGPGGAIAGFVLASAGLDAVVLEKEPASRFHVGESMLPRTVTQLETLGLWGKMGAIPQVRKEGATFASGSGTCGPSHFPFSNTLTPGESRSFSLEREPFDAWLLDEAEAAGADVRRGQRVRSVERLSPESCTLRTDTGTLHSRIVIDASGHSTVVGRHMNTRRVLPGHERVAHGCHMTGVHRDPMPEGGYTVIVMVDDGWFWLIPLDETRTSVGVILPAGLSRSVGVPADRALRWAIERCPEVRRRVADADIPEKNFVMSDFSYDCAPYAAPGYFLVGDAAGFIDPVFSGGVCLAMLSGQWAAEAAIERITRNTAWDAVTGPYRSKLDRSLQTLLSMVEHYYMPPYRDLLHHGKGPMRVDRATLELLSGAAFPQPRFAVRWRTRLMDLFMHAQRRVPLVPRMPRWSLADAEADPLDVRTGPLAGAMAT